MVAECAISEYPWGLTRIERRVRRRHGAITRSEDWSMYLTLRRIVAVARSLGISFDGTVIVRPSFRISQRWLFNPTVSVGGGDSKYFYQLQPQFQYQFSKTWEARFGYRKMHYTIDASRGARYDMNLSGPLIGFGATF
jgi:hypothetical protein